MEELINVARGLAEADLVLKNGYVVNVFTRTAERADVAISGSRIAGVGTDYKGKREIDCSGFYVMPGFIDTHVHIESSMLSPVEFCKAILRWGTTTFIADPHEIANVCGEAGVLYMIDECAKVPVNAHMMLPSCVPATRFESAGAEIDAKTAERMIKDPEIFGLGEFMNARGVIENKSECAEKLAAASRAGKIADGHCPCLAGKDLAAYIAAGIKTDHECAERASMIERVKMGMYVQMREGSAAKNIAELIKGVNDANLRRITFCTDDMHADALTRGHISLNLAKAVECGLDPLSAVVIATLNAAECYGLRDRGAIAPGYAADIAVCRDLKDFTAEYVLVRGELVAQAGKTFCGAVPSADIRVMNTVRHDGVKPEDFEIKSGSKFVNAIKITDQSLVTGRIVRKVKIRKDGSVNTDGSGLLKLAVVERHKRTGNIGRALLENCGLKGGAIAQTIAHDSHNIIVLGDNDGDMACAVNELIRIGGGIAVASRSRILDSLPLEIGGLMTALPLEQFHERFIKLCECARALDVGPGAEPFMTLSFLALPVIPHVKLTDKGLFDVTKFEFLPIEAEESEYEE
ncbi:MAG: adenine deaminase [Firmicutes bacterium]|nr:adenine deaminase [Bacillota bacterium]